MDALSTGRPTADIIPYFDIAEGGPVDLCGLAPERLESLIEAGRAHYGSAALAVGDGISRSWLTKARNPYVEEIDRVAETVGTAGAFLLNLSYEWTCTTGIGRDPSGRGNRLLRTLDWPLDGLGRNVVVARQAGPAGNYFSATWPGFTGVLTAMAHGRFSAAINQPPMRRWTPSCWFDWVINRGRTWQSRALPPVHLLRRVFETCASFDDALRLLSEMPLALPAFFTLSGNGADEGAVIERDETRAWVRRSPSAAANHWLDGGNPGDRMRGEDSPGRLSLMERLRDGTGDGFDWVQPPILNATTRLAVVANANTGTFVVRGYERDGPVTAPFSLDELLT